MSLSTTAHSPSGPPTPRVRLRQGETALRVSGAGPGSSGVGGERARMTAHVAHPAADRPVVAVEVEPRGVRVRLVRHHAREAGFVEHPGALLESRLRTPER